jgi:hypothetical protein
MSQAFRLARDLAVGAVSRGAEVLAEMMGDDSYRDIAIELLRRATRDDGVRAAILYELAQWHLMLADQADRNPLIRATVELAQTVH